MPCYEPPTEGEAFGKQHLPAVLCQLIKRIGLDTVLKTFDWKEAGIDPDGFLAWWKEHEERDARRNRLQLNAKPEAPRDWVFRVVIEGRPDQYAMDVNEAWRMVGRRRNNAEWVVYDRKGVQHPHFFSI